jgi:hypothetical protein
MAASADLVTERVTIALTMPAVPARQLRRFNKAVFSVSASSRGASRLSFWRLFIMGVSVSER